VSSNHTTTRDASAGHEEIDVTGASDSLQRYRIIDVREPHEYDGELGHIAGSRLVPLGELIERLDAGHSPHDVLGIEAETDGALAALLIVCRSGGRSGKACVRLVEAGLSGVVNLAGGMLEWNRAGLPVHRATADHPEQTG